MKQFKKLTALLLTAALVLSLFPAAVFAVEGEEARTCTVCGFAEKRKLEKSAPDPVLPADAVPGDVDGVDGITFDRDVLDTNRPGDWGAVELSGQDDSEWADGQLIDQVLTSVYGEETHRDPNAAPDGE